MMSRRIVFVVLLVLAVLAGEWVWLNAGQHLAASEDAPVITVHAAAPGGGFALVDHTGRSVTSESFHGKFVLMLFGYTSCPDVCPTALATIAAAVDLLGDRASDVQPIFVTVDPERDTPAVLARYVAAFHDRLVGLTGSAEQIRRVTEDFRVYYARAGTGANYWIDHSAYVYLLRPDGRMLTYFKPDTTAEAIARAITDVMAADTQPVAFLAADD